MKHEFEIYGEQEGDRFAAQLEFGDTNGPVQLSKQWVDRDLSFHAHGNEFIEYDVILNNAMSGPTVTFNVYGEMDDETKRKVVSSAVQYLTHLLGSVEQGDFQFTESKLGVRDQLIPLYNERHRLSKEEREILDALDQ